MGRVIIFENLQQKAKKAKKVSSLLCCVTKRKAKEDSAEVPNGHMGSGDAWSCYWQPYFAAAWKMVKNKEVTASSSPC